MDDTEGHGFDERLRRSRRDRAAAKQHLSDTRGRWLRIQALLAAGRAVQTDNHIAQKLRNAYGVGGEDDR